MKVIDFESHYLTKNLYDLAASRVRFPFYRPDNLILYLGAGDAMVPYGMLKDNMQDIADMRVSLMDKAGIDVSVISCSMFIERLEPDVGIKAAIDSNNEVAAEINKYPSRLIGYAVLAEHNVEGSCRELERCKKELGFKGWATFSNYGDLYLDDERCFPLLAKAEELGMFVYIHPSVPNFDRAHGLGFALAGAGLGFSIDTSTTLIRLIVNGTFDRLPNLKVMIGHLGETIPFFLERLEDTIKWLQFHEHTPCKQLPSYYFKKNIWVTTSGNFSKPAYDCAKAILGEDKIIFASDYPFQPMKVAVEFVNSLGKEDAERVFYENAIAGLGLDLK
jgi:uncharacterized protein